MTQEYDEWSYMAADNTRQVGGWCKKYPRLTWATVKGDLFSGFLKLFLIFKTSFNGKFISCIILLI